MESIGPALPGLLLSVLGFLNDTGAFLITKSGGRVCKYFGISKYTLYSYIEEAKSGKE